MEDLIGKILLGFRLTPAEAHRIVCTFMGGPLKPGAEGERTMGTETTYSGVIGWLSWFCSALKAQASERVEGRRVARVTAFPVASTSPGPRSR